jgi:putative SbcD/Mre11-related phosphoesterase
MTKITPIYNEPALLLNNKILVIADLHLGLELELQNEGINLPSQTDKILNRILKLCSKYKIKKLIILGDIKHNIPNILYQELKDITRMFEILLAKCPNIEIIAGNHDGTIRKLLPRAIKVHSSKGCVIEKIGLFHGHAYPSQEVLACKELITAHIHPVVALNTGLGARISEQCWLKFKSSNNVVIIMPAFNKLCGYAVNIKLKLRPPLSKIISLSKASIYLLDGTSLGKLCNLLK